MGIFTSDSTATILTSSTSAPVYSGAPERKAVLLGHIVATKTTNPTVTDDDMNIPSSSRGSDVTVGHREEGRTICIHSLAVLPAYQRRGLGKTLMKAYLQRMETQGVADRAALIAHQELIPYYEALGFESLGASRAQFAGGGWFDMVRELRGESSEEEEEF
jgi:predicted N-acetyltransferase YhbS